MHRVVVASSAYVNGCCLRAAIDGMSGKVLARQWCNREKPLPTRLCSYGVAPTGVFVCDGMKIILKACAEF